MTTFFSLRRSVADLPIPRKLALILGLFCLVVIGLLSLGYFGMTMLAGSRAYVQGEALYSKAQKDAVQRLTRYALLHDEADYRDYLKAITIPLGDHQARLEMAKSPIDFAAVRQGFIQGRNHPADVDVLIWMALHLHKFHYMSQAIDLWGQADASIEALTQVAGRLHAEINSGHPSVPRVKALLNDIQTIDAQVTPLEDAFSFTLGEGGRWLKATLLAVMVLATGVLLGAALLISVWISKSLCAEIDLLRAGAARIANGDYSLSLDIKSKDEIGDLARTFQQMAQQRQEAERLKDEFFANVSHELRTPLTLILSPLESVLAGDYGTPDGRVTSALQTMHNNTVRLLQLVNGLLDFSKLEAGKVSVSREPVRIGELTQMVFNDFQPMLGGKKINARLVSHAGDAVVLMDHYLYERILFNLLSNAVKFTPADGTVTVDLSYADERLTLSVSDSGVGIPSGALDSIFQRFHQVEGSSTRRFEGTGLGLALVKEFAGLLKGTVMVTSRVGEGSVFTVCCSAPAAASGTAVLARATSGHVVQRYAATPSVGSTEPPASVEALPKVLIAEDNVEMAAYIETLLRPFTLVKIVDNGHDALKLARDWRPDLILTDVMMPTHDGLSLCRDIKSDPATAMIPVIMLTALTHREALLEGWKAGANEYLFKPFHPKELTTRIQSLLKIGRLGDTIRRHVVEVEEANKELEAFSYSVSHDLRTPLRTIDGFSKELLDNPANVLDSQSKTDLARIRAAVKRMGQLIEDLLELSHLSRQDLKREHVDLSRVASEITQKLQADQPDRPAESVIASALNVDGDAHLLEIALTNLIQNSFKFTQRTPHPRIEFNAQKKEGKTIFYLRDNGVGFNMDYAHQLFKPFQRLHDGKQYPGTGIGLALVQRIIQRHGGQIWVEAEENRGATFYFTLG